ncbi:GntR family transcriptional regulator [Lacticaseibacillus camelliae]|uniref:GntR family transcriptional regulator n=1 Tax=Lacticaseibacillus camelliae DSM 22697 = JCM 13995 TaxID=1423730 RepID=A0A0R2F101_9LACO|nr:GntR family transcriptional regulator [Lacticaseibacillus camelliae]KRN19127.1 GntR family transcriptional regulator [Lacticaseibacillus camelliae DSM 22697 = JCM 13995]
MEFDDKVPIYFQIEQYIDREIIVGNLAPGAQVPAVRQLALTLTVNVNTIQRALTELIREGILVSERGKGNFVTTDTAVLAQMKKRVIQGELAGTYDHLAALGMQPAEMVAALEEYIKERKGGESHD